VKAVIFDLGDVFVEVDHAKALRELRSHRGAGAAVVASIDGALELMRGFECGRLTTPQFHEALCRREELSVDLEHIYCDIFSPVEEMIEANARLRRAGLPTYLFSNTSELHFSYIRSRYPFTSEFTDYFLSYELGCMKPDAGAYAVVEQRTGLGGSELLYIDDRLENIQAGAQRGWETIHHMNARLTVAAFQSRRLV